MTKGYLIVINTPRSTITSPLYSGGAVKSGFSNKYFWMKVRGPIKKESTDRGVNSFFSLTFGFHVNL